MKKVLAVVLVVCVMCAAGSAFAQPSAKRQPQQFQRQNFAQYDCGRCPCYDDPRVRDFRGAGRDFDGRGNNMDRPEMNRGPEMNRMPFAPDMPKEIREKVTELAKLRIDLEEALTSNPVNKAKALDVHAKMQKLEQEIEAWRFAQKLDRIEEMRTQREINRKIKPVPPAPKPEDKPEEKPEAPAE